MDRLLAASMERPGPLTRADLMSATSLSAPTVGSLSAELVRLGLLRELGQAPSTGGRRPRVLQFNAHHGFVVGFVLGERTARLALADLRGEIVAATQAEAPRASGPERVLEGMEASIRSLLADAGVPRDQLLVVCGGLPGAVDRARGRVVALMPTLEVWEDVNVGAAFEQALGVPVVVENDVNLAVLGEHWQGVARGHDTCAFISLGTGIGAGILLNGELHQGHHSLAGEIALMCLGPEHLTRDFGSRGCFETLAGLDAVVRGWRPKARGDLEAHARALLQAARAGEASARRALREAATLVGIAATHLSLVIDPSLLVFGGSLVEHDGGLLEEIRGIVTRVIPRPPRVEASVLGEKAALWGSLLVATEEARGQLRRRVREPVSVEQEVS